VTVLAQEPTEEPDEPTETPEPPVVQEPVIDDFGVSPTTIEQGQMVTASWTTSGGTTRIELLRNDEAIWADTQLNNSQADTPPQAAPSTVVYTLKAYNNADQVETRSVEVQIAQAPPQNPLAGTTWQLQAMQGPGAVPGEVTITAHFGGNGGLSGNGGCNSYSASYSAEGNSIAIRNPSSEMAACGDPADSLERAYLELLPQAANFEIRDGLLIVLGNTGAEILRFFPLG
jgi:heat shock protein HslJ